MLETTSFLCSFKHFFVCEEIGTKSERGKFEKNISITIKFIISV